MILGEFIQYETSNIYNFAVTGLPVYKNYKLYAYFEDLQGNLCSKSIE